MPFKYERDADMTDITSEITFTPRMVSRVTGRSLCTRACALIWEWSGVVPSGSGPTFPSDLHWLDVSAAHAPETGDIPPAEREGVPDDFFLIDDQVGVVMEKGHARF